MEAPSPSVSNPELVSFEISSNGNPIDSTYQVYSITVTKAANKISSATIQIVDGTTATESWSASESSAFIPGNTIEIKLGYGSNNQTVFKGLVTKQNLRLLPGSGPVLVVECKDEAVKMTIGRNSACFKKQKDSQVINSLISKAGLTANVTATAYQWPELVQYYATDWDFIVSRAEVNSMLVYTDAGKVTVAPPDPDPAPVLTVTYGQDMLDFDGTLDAETQLSTVKSSAWDPATQKIVTGTAANTHPGPGNLSSATLADVVGPATYELQTTGPLDSDNLGTWAKGQLTKSTYSKIRGTVRFQGNTGVNPGNYVTIAGMGARFNGNNFVSGVQHEVRDGNWTTSCQLGLDPQWFTEAPGVTGSPASGLLPGVRGLLNGIVQQIDQDPENEYRIRVKLPVISPDDDGVWARLATIYASSGAGAFFIPEVGDEVIVAFLNEDPRYPVILGSVYSSKNKPPFPAPADAKNVNKGIVTKGKCQFTIEDEKHIITLKTPNENQIVIDDYGRSIAIKDQNGNAIMMSSSGIDLKSATNINLTANQRVSIKGTTGVTIEASAGDTTIKGLNVNANGSVGFSGKGGLTAELSSGTNTTVKGAMVMIN